MGARFYFEPTCPWTWMTSRWLVEVAGQTDLTIDWRSFSLSVLDEDDEEHRLGLPALRLVESLRSAGRNDDVGRFYTEFGTRFHLEGAHAPTVVASAAKAASVDDHLAASDDPAWDDAVRASLEEALQAAGPNIGSPVLVIDGNARGAMGPIVSPFPKGQEALRLWDAVVTLHSLPAFHELKRGRTKPPALLG